MNELQQKIRRHATHTSELYRMSDGDLGCPECDLEDRYSRLLDILQQYTANDDALEAGLPFDTYTKEYNRIYALAKAAVEESR